MIRLGQSVDGRLVMASNQEMPADIARVEYYRDLRLFMLVYEGQDENGEEKSDLMPCEMSKEVAQIIHNSPDIIVVAMNQAGREPFGYIAPLVQIGL